VCEKTEDLLFLVFLQWHCTIAEKTNPETFLCVYGLVCICTDTCLPVCGGTRGEMTKNNFWQDRAPPLQNSDHNSAVKECLQCLMMIIFCTTPTTIHQWRNACSALCSFSSAQLRPRFISKGMPAVPCAHFLLHNSDHDSSVKECLQRLVLLFLAQLWPRFISKGMPAVPYEYLFLHNSDHDLSVRDCLQRLVLIFFCTTPTMIHQWRNACSALCSFSSAQLRPWFIS